VSTEPRNSSSATPTLGIDIGRVLITPGQADGRDTSFLGASISDAILTPPYPGMFDVVPDLVEAFDGRVWLVSKASPPTQERTRRWLAHHRFFERTGVPAENLCFCLERSQKAAICSANGITHFIDDRQDVLNYMKNVVSHRYLFGPQKTSVAPGAGLTQVLSWPDVSRELLGYFR
jgi:hypothetical protein